VDSYDVRALLDLAGAKDPTASRQLRMLALDAVKQSERWERIAREIAGAMTTHPDYHCWTSEQILAHFDHGEGLPTP